MSKDCRISMICYFFTNVSNAYFLIRIVIITVVQVFLTSESTRNPRDASFVTEYMQVLFVSVKKTIASKFSII